MLSLIPKTLTLSLSSRATTRLILILHSFKPIASRHMSTQRMFQLKLDPLTGNSEWVVIEENEDVPESSQEPLLATTSYLDMLNDSYRNRAYRLAIDKMVTKSCHVLDIGAGTGLLSMMAARAMGSSDSTTSLNTKGMVTACESYLPMVKLMKKVLHVNGMGRNIKVINKRSDELEVGVDIDSRADILVSEILDSELLGEGLIPTLQHAHDRLLVENPLTVPCRVTTYGQLVESTFLWKLHDLYNNEAKALDDIHLVPAGMDSILHVKSQQYAMHCDAITKEIKLLSEPFKIFEFDFWKRPDSHGEAELQIKSTDDGRVHAVVSWWVLQLDREGTIFYSTAPRWISLPIHKSTGNWCDHWKQCVWFIPGKGMSICKGEELLFHALHTETSVSYELKSQIPITDERQHNLNAKDFQLALPPERIAIYGDGEWRLSMVMAMRNALQGRVQPLCVVADDSVFLTICVARLSKTAHVLSLLPGLGDKGAQYLRTVADPNCFSIDRVEILQKGKKCLTMDDTQQKKVDLLIGEPYYFGNDGMLPWQNLRFWKERSKLDPVLSKEVIIMPFKGILKACAIFCPDIWNSRRSLSKIEGFDHAVVNTTLGACGDLPAPKEGPCLPFFTWQCGEIKKLSNVFTVMEFDFSKPISPCQGKVQVEFTELGLCHGFALWIDWVMDSENSIIISTGPDKRYWKQGVKLMAKPVAVGFEGSGRTDLCSSTLVEASFNPSNGELNVQHTFS
ncbi:protein arginine N-methyltransferase 1.6 [Citrus sinensis]|uniref:protein arginine N-methyltransferase 1.6 isoform X2 n=1 Tax=Citrus sinensis TaxID=2711 RepID=UPI00219EC427|nr:protein arginine N-methyltransferase 1.6 isoform X2 [Citrus sinensis]KAH9721294.1 protein arginine N-methyltransferase 1.6 [Citrus sinensis]